MNRPKYKATSKLTKEIWDNFHQNVQKFINQSIKRFGYCIVLDLHGNSRAIDHIQLGYGLTNKQIIHKIKKSSVQPFSQYFNIQPETLMYGKQSLCDIIIKNGISCIPNSHIKENLSLYFNGGFITKFYSKKYKHKPLAIIQIELPKKERELINIQQTSNILAKSIYQFMKYIKKYTHRSRRRTRRRRRRKKTRKKK